MSVATECAPAVDIPAPAHLRGGRLAAVTVLHRPDERSVAAPLRLTNRGAGVLAVAVAVTALALIGTAWLSLPRPAATASLGRAPATVTVRSGDSLWSIAERVAPRRDPRAEVDALQRANHLRDTGLVPGQVLRTG